MTEATWGGTPVSAIQNRLPTRYVARNLICLDSTTSTQDRAKEAVKIGAPEGTVVLTDEQTQGRGRFQRAWVSARGGSILFSLVLRPSYEVAPRLPIVVALAAVRAIHQEAGLVAVIKWPNDIQIGGKKLAGILIDAMVHQEEFGYAIVGMGLNVGMDPAAHPDIAPIATGLQREAGRSIDRVAIFTTLMGQIETVYEAAKSGDSLISEYRANLVTLGKQVKVAWPDPKSRASIEGVAEDVDDSGALLLRKADGSLVQLIGGEVSLRAS